MKKVFTRPRSLKQTPFHYCPGCGHSLLHRLIGEVIDEMDLREEIIVFLRQGVPFWPTTISTLTWGSCHGRAAALATGLKRALPDRVIFTYQGDGDIAAIGTAETIHAGGSRTFTTIFVNNAVYGMTAGRWPRPVLGHNHVAWWEERAARCYPIKLSEMLALAQGGPTSRGQR